MPTSIRKKTRQAVAAGLSRRDLFRRTSLIMAGGLLPGGWSPSAEAAPDLSFGADMYQSIGVRPLINCKGVFTSLSGSLMLPEVRQAMAQASMNFVHIDELMEAVSKRLAAITGDGQELPAIDGHRQLIGRVVPSDVAFYMHISKLTSMERASDSPTSVA